MLKVIFLFLLFHFHYQLSMFQNLTHSFELDLGLRLLSLVFFLVEFFLILKLVFERASARVESP